MPQCGRISGDRDGVDLSADGCRRSLDLSPLGVAPQEVDQLALDPVAFGDARASVVVCGRAEIVE